MFLKENLVHSARIRLLKSLCKNWRTKGVSLLQVGNNYRFSPKIFTFLGYDTALYLFRDQKASIPLQGADILYGDVDDFPFADAEFDYAVLVHPSFEYLHTIFKECYRVTKRGILILSWNKFSFFDEILYLDDTSEKIQKLSPFIVQKNLSSLIKVSSKLESNLYLNPIANNLLLDKVNLLPSPTPFGGLFGIKFDWNSVPLNPSGLLFTALDTVCPSIRRPEHTVFKEAKEYHEFSSNTF